MTVGNTHPPLWTGADIADAVGGRLSAPFEAGGVQIDSRDVEAGDLFIALSGASADGHDFIDQIAGRGAAGALVDRPVSVPHVEVADTYEALIALAGAARARGDAKVIGVTGSVGKTGTKEALAAALARAPGARVHRSVKSFNNHVGVPLSLARMPADSDFAVFEMGMNHVGELAALTRMVRPHVAIITAIAPAHIAHFADENAIANAKGEIFLGLEPGGTALIPHESPHRDRLIAAARPYAERIWTFGFDAGADIRARDVVTGSAQGVGANSGAIVNAVFPGGDLNFTLGPAGQHWVSNALAVIGAVLAVGGDLCAAGLALGDFANPAGRGARHAVRVGDGEALLIDESYNANPASMRATLSLLGNEPAKRRIAILGEMRELGAQSDALHAALADPVHDAGVDCAILVGSAMAPLAEALADRLDVRQVPDAAAALEMVESLLAPGDAVLVKGSNGVGLSRLVTALKVAG